MRKKRVKKKAITKKRNTIAIPEGEEKENITEKYLK